MDDEPDCGYFHSMARKMCVEGISLSWENKTALNTWGDAEINLRVAELIPLSPAKLEVLTQSARKAESEHTKIRHDYIEHVAGCLECSKKIMAL